MRSNGSPRHFIRIRASTACSSPASRAISSRRCRRFRRRKHKIFPPRFGGKARWVRPTFTSRRSIPVHRTGEWRRRLSARCERRRAMSPAISGFGCSSSEWENACRRSIWPTRPSARSSIKPARHFSRTTSRLTRARRRRGSPRSSTRFVRPRPARSSATEIFIRSRPSMPPAG